MLLKFPLLVLILFASLLNCDEINSGGRQHPRGLDVSDDYEDNEEPGPGMVSGSGIQIVFVRPSRYF